MIAYKVVLNYSHYNGYFESINAPPKYKLKYKIGEITKTIPDTLGIMCFKTYDSAQGFARFYDFIRILKVEGINKGKTPRKICGFLDDSDFNEFYEGKKTFLGRIPDNTICFDSIKPLKIED